MVLCLVFHPWLTYYLSLKLSLQRPQRWLNFNSSASIVKDVAAYSGIDGFEIEQDDERKNINNYVILEEKYFSSLAVLIIAKKDESEATFLDEVEEAPDISRGELWGMVGKLCLN